MIDVVTPETHPELVAKKLFLGGTIENGQAEDWQSKFIIGLSAAASDAEEKDGRPLNFTIMNPRRENWDPNADDEQINKQILWEQTCLKQADIVVIHFTSDGTGVITQLELGQCLERYKQGEIELYVSCHPQYARRLNVIATAELYGLLVEDSWLGTIEILTVVGTE